MRASAGRQGRAERLAGRRAALGRLRHQGTREGRLAGQAAGRDRHQARHAIGTAGYTSMLCVQALEKHGITPASGEVLVTGAAGGVGSVAVAILAKAWIQRRGRDRPPAEGDYLKSLRRHTIMDRKELTEARTVRFGERFRRRGRQRFRA